MHTKVIEIKEYTSDKVGLLIQAILSEMVIIFGIISLFEEKFSLVFFAALSLTMFTLAYNNVKFYKKKYMTFIYIIFGLFIIASTIMEYLV